MDAFAAQRRLTGEARHNVAASIAGEAAVRHAEIEAAEREAMARAARGPRGQPLDRRSRGSSPHRREHVPLHRGRRQAHAGATRGAGARGAHERRTARPIVVAAVEAGAAAAASIVDAGMAACEAMRRCAAEHGEAAARSSDWNPRGTGWAHACAEG